MLEEEDLEVVDEEEEDGGYPYDPSKYNLDLSPPASNVNVSGPGSCAAVVVALGPLLLCYCGPLGIGRRQPGLCESF